MVTVKYPEKKKDGRVYYNKITVPQQYVMLLCQHLWFLFYFAEVNNNNAIMNVQYMNPFKSLRFTEFSFRKMPWFILMQALSHMGVKYRAE